MRLASVVGIALLAYGVAARADVYQVAITSGSDAVTFDVPSAPVDPMQTGTGGFELNGLDFDFDGEAKTGDIAFYPTTTPFPGIEFELGTDFYAVEGIQVFSGTTESPTFILNTFASTDTIGLAGSTATVVITDLTPAAPSPSGVPEPSSVALLGIGIIGLLGTRRSRRT